MPKASVKRLINNKKNKLIKFVLDIDKYPEFIPLVNNELKQRISLIADEENYVEESYWK